MRSNSYSFLNKFFIIIGCSNFILNGQEIFEVSLTNLYDKSVCVELDRIQTIGQFCQTSKGKYMFDRNLRKFCYMYSTPQPFEIIGSDTCIYVRDKIRNEAFKKRYSVENVNLESLNLDPFWVLRKITQKETVMLLQGVCDSAAIYRLMLDSAENSNPNLILIRFKKPCNQLEVIELINSGKNVIWQLQLHYKNKIPCGKFETLEKMVILRVIDGIRYEEVIKIKKVTFPLSISDSQFVEQAPKNWVKLP